MQIQGLSWYPGHMTKTKRMIVLNFFLMGLTVQNAVLLEEKEARDKMKL